MAETNLDLISLTADIVSAHVSNNTVAPSELPTLISTVYGALTASSAPPPPSEPAPTPAIAVRSSVKNDYIVCLEDGKKLKMLKRYLRTNYNMSPEEYRSKWGLPRDYPMVAPAYAEQRRSLAKTIGLGRKPGEKPTAPTKSVARAKKAPPAVTAPKKAPARKPAAKKE